VDHTLSLHDALPIWLSSLESPACRLIAKPTLVHRKGPTPIGGQIWKPFDMIRAPKQFVRVVGAGHNDLGDQTVAAAKQFIARHGADATKPLTRDEAGA
jgi:hypothetical protein